MTLLIIISLLYLIASASSAGDQVKHLMNNGANLIETMQGFAINSPALEQNNIKTVSVYGDKVMIVAPNCQQNIVSRQQLNANHQNLLANTINQLRSVETNQPQQMMGAYRGPSRSAVAYYSLDQMAIGESHVRNMNLHSFSSNGNSLSKYDNNNMSIKKPNMPNNINRIFVNDDVVTFVYNDGKVQMKPINCLTPAEQHLVQQVKLELQQAQLQFDQSMKQFHHNMQQNMHNMHQNIQNMQSRFGNMFGGQQAFNPFNRFPSQQQQSYGNNMMSQYQMPGQTAQMMNGGYATANAGGHPAGAQSAGVYGVSGPSMFGNNFPFGPNNSPFYPGFPFGSN